MKSRTSFFDRTVLKKDLTRFAPAWILYAIILVILGTITAGRTGTYVLTLTTYQEYSIAQQLAATQGAMLVINFLFALLNAQLLFGDLFNTRLANALHAMPIRRETWFATHVFSGILFSLIPNLIYALVFTFLTGALWLTAWCWLGAVTLQYLFFFGVAVFACFCVGSRFAQGVVYSLCNFGAWLLFWTVDTLYMPLIPGISITFELLSPFCPIIHGFTLLPFDVNVKRWDGMANKIEWQRLEQDPSGWIYLLVVAAIGVGLLFLAMRFYRRRHLEVAGDFIAVSWLKPVFLLVYTFSVGIVTYYLLSNFAGLSTVFLILGLLVGYVSGTMFLERTIKVFHKRMLTGLAVLAVFLGSTMGLTVLDPLGLKNWVPDADQIQVVYFTVPAAWNYNDTKDPEAFEIITEIHRSALEHGTLDTADFIEDMQAAIVYTSDGYYYNGAHRFSYNDEGYLLTINYQIDGGIYMDRTYGIPYASPTAALISAYMNEPEQVLQTETKKWQSQLDRFYLPPVDGTVYLYPTEAEARALMDAILADCAAGTMLQHDCFHEERGANLQVRFGDGHKGTAGQFQITVYPEAVNTRAWMEERGLYILAEDYPAAEEAYFP